MGIQPSGYLVSRGFVKDDIECDISLKNKGILKSDHRYKIKVSSKLVKKKTMVNLQIGDVRSVHSNITPDSFV